MAATFEPANIAENGKDRVRLEVGDTDPDDALLADETYEALLADAENWQQAASLAARAIAAQFTRQVSLVAGAVKLDYQQRAASYRELAAGFESRLPGGGGSNAAAEWGFPMAGGMAGPEGNYFRVGMHDGLPLDDRAYPEGPPDTGGP